MTTVYITLADVQQAVGERKLAQLTNDDPAAVAAGVADAAVVETAIAGACEMVDGYLRARHQLPLEPVPTVVRELALNLACYRLYARRMESAVPETLRERRDHAIKVLEHIQSGKVTFGDAATGKIVPEAGAMRFNVPPAQFGEDTLAQWRM